jgi:hypothetical protein
MSFVVYWIALYFLELIKMELITIRLLDYKSNKKHYIYIIGLLGMFLAISMIYMGLVDESIISFLFIIIIILVFFKALTGYKKYLGILFSYVLLSVVDVILAGGFTAILGMDTDTLMNDYILGFIANSLSVPLLIIVVLIKNRRKIDLTRARIYLKSRHLLLMIIGIFACGLYIAPIQIYGLTEKGSHVKNLVTFGFTTSGIVFIVLCLFYFLGNADKIQYRQKVEAKEKLLIQQQQYYKALIENDENTKKFRHDISNHIYCLSYLCKEKKYDELEKYLTDMECTIQELKLKIYTGNEVVNVIVNDLQKRYEENYIQFLWTGILSENIKISSMDLCTIFSNLLTNSIEAVMKINNYNKRIVNIQIKQLDNNIIIYISNPVLKKVNIINNKLVTTKRDKNQHGYGSLNVEECIEKYDSIINYSCDDDCFTVKILLYDIITE